MTKKITRVEWNPLSNKIHLTHLADGEHRVVGFSHGVVDEHGHQFSDFVQISCPGFLSNEETRVKKKQGYRTTSFFKSIQQNDNLLENCLWLRLK